MKPLIAVIFFLLAIVPYMLLASATWLYFCSLSSVLDFLGV